MTTSSRPPRSRSTLAGSRPERRPSASRMRDLDTTIVDEFFEGRPDQAEMRADLTADLEDEELSIHVFATAHGAEYLRFDRCG